MAAGKALTSCSSDSTEICFAFFPWKITDKNSSLQANNRLKTLRSIANGLDFTKQIENSWLIGTHIWKAILYRKGRRMQCFSAHFIAYDAHTCMILLFTVLWLMDFQSKQIRLQNYVDARGGGRRRGMGGVLGDPWWTNTVHIINHRHYLVNKICSRGPWCCTAANRSTYL